MSKVSVIVPVYNPAENYLKQCINSIINQTFKDLEIILVDNEATGENSAILKEYAESDKRIKLIIFEKNKGFAGAVNAGLKAATGEFVSIIDSDDWLEENAVQVLHDKLNNSDLDMTIFCARTFDDKIKDFTDEIMYTFHEIPKKYDNSFFQFSDVKDFILHCPTQAWNKFYRKSFLINNNSFVDEELGSAGADALFTFYNYVNAKKTGIIRSKLYNYRTNVGLGVVATLKKKDCKNFMFNFTLFDKINKLIVDKKLPSDLALAFAEINIQQLLFFFRMIHSSNKPVYYKELRKCLCSLPADIYTNELYNLLKIKEIQDWEDVKKIQKNKIYIFYKLKNFIYHKEYLPNMIKSKVFNITFYKKYIQSNKEVRKYLGCIKITKQIS